MIRQISSKYLKYVLAAVAAGGMTNAITLIFFNNTTIAFFIAGVFTSTVAVGSLTIAIGMDIKTKIRALGITK